MDWMNSPTTLIRFLRVISGLLHSSSVAAVPPWRICSTSQLYAATLALESASQMPVAPNGTRIRNLCLMAEAVMNDARHTFLMFAPDFCNPAYKQHPLYDTMLAAFEPPFKGRLARETVQSSKLSWAFDTNAPTTRPLRLHGFLQCLSPVTSPAGKTAKGAHICKVGQCCGAERKVRKRSPVQ